MQRRMGFRSPGGGGHTEGAKLSAGYCARQVGALDYCFEDGGRPKAGKRMRGREAFESTRAVGCAASQT